MNIGVGTREVSLKIYNVLRRQMAMLQAGDARHVREMMMLK